MQKISLFKIRVIREDRVYLLASDVKEALGYSGNSEQFEIDHQGIVKSFDELPGLVLESDFNNIFLKNREAFERMGHIELTRVETLRNKTESLKNFYPLKLLIGGKKFELEALQAGYQNVADYIKEVNFRKEIEDAKISIIEKKDLIECYKRSKENLEERIDYKVLDQYNLQVQQYIRIKDGVPYLESFIVGEGIFFSVYDSDYAFEHLRIDKQDLIVPTYDYDTGCLDINYGHDIGKRDYRKYETLENIRYLISCKNVEEVGVDLLCCEAPGISFYISQAEVIKLFNPNMYRNIILIDGCIEFDYSKVVTQGIQ